MMFKNRTASRMKFLSGCLIIFMLGLIAFVQHSSGIRAMSGALQSQAGSGGWDVVTLTLDKAHAFPDDGAPLEITLAVTDAPAEATVADVSLAYAITYPQPEELQIGLSHKDVDDVLRLVPVGEKHAVDPVSAARRFHELNGAPVNGEWVLTISGFDANASGVLDSLSIQIYHATIGKALQEAREESAQPVQADTDAVMDPSKGVFLPLVQNPPPSFPALDNSSFDRAGDHTSWEESSSGGYQLVVSESYVREKTGGSFDAHSSPNLAWLGGAPNELSTLGQSVTLVAADLPDVSVNFHYWISSQETNCDDDKAYVRMGEDTVLTFHLCAQNNTDGWTRKTVNLDAYVGETVTLRFEADTGDNLNSNWFIDGVTLCNTTAANLCPDMPTPTSTPTWTPTPTWTSTHTPTPTPTWTPTRRPTSTFTPTPTHTPTFTHTPTHTPTWTPTPTWTSTPTWTPTHTPTFTPRPSTPTPTDTPTWTPTPVSGPGPGWTYVGHANGVVSMASSAGYLYAATSGNTLWRRYANGSDLAWADIGQADHITGMAASGGYLYAATSSNRLLRRPANGSYLTWTDIGHVNLGVGMAASGGYLYVATSSNRLWRRVANGSDLTWIEIGHANGVTAMSAYNGDLYAVTGNGTLWRRTANGSDLTWIDIGQAANITGMSASGGWLYAATNDNGLWRRGASVLSEK